ncbi:hypothetical protein KQY30_07205 [Streptomyces sp. GMY02]|uniref:hypothetical protein n=1 Tax=Streptomyces sp. GMY02 TaxID=1333528 RepID=UPI001C2BCF1B|nr:hypothetical protein KQY30_07205 [Streptomyces sp. GMY02]
MYRRAVRTPHGRPVQVTDRHRPPGSPTLSGVRPTRSSGFAYDPLGTHTATTLGGLTVDDLHTYYAVAGATPVLVHNCGGKAARLYA